MSKPRYLISACLCGYHCRYDGGSFDYPALRQLADDGLALPFCPECAGGLPTPRTPCEIVCDANGVRTVISRAGIDCTAEYCLGAEKALALCREHSLVGAILKDGSPSCGVTRIYDGTHTGRCIAGQGDSLIALTKRHCVTHRT
jgi:uncharacterized protein YbbK (DUF523 family)